MSDLNKRLYFKVPPLAAILIPLVLLPLAAWAKESTANVSAPNGKDDTANIQAALDKCVAHGPDCTVQLSAGTYLTKQLVAYNFHGTFRGISTGKTTIQALYPLPVNTPDVYYDGECMPNTTSCLWPTLIMFIEGDIHVSDLSINIVAPPGTATTGWSFGGTTYTDVIDAVRFTGQHPIHATVDRINVEGLPDNSSTSSGFNLVNGVVFPGEVPRSSTPFDYYLQSGSLTVHNSSFKSMDDGVAWAHVASSEMTVGGSSSTGNTFDNVFVGLDMESAETSQVDVSYNRSTGITNSMWVIPWLSFVFIPSAPSRYLIHDNTFYTSGPNATGIYLYNEPGSPWIDAVIWNNTIDLQETLSDGIDAVNTKGTAILNNSISGTGYNGIGLWANIDSMVIGNRVSDYTPDATSGLAQIHLDPSTNKDLVLCAETNDTVLNQGTNNVIIGCDQSGATPEAMRMKAGPVTATTGRNLAKRKPWLR